MISYRCLEMNPKILGVHQIKTTLESLFSGCSNAHFTWGKWLFEKSYLKRPRSPTDINFQEEKIQEPDFFTQLVSNVSL